MKVFISWSGEQSKRYGEVLRGWLPNVHQNVEPFFSPDDIEKGKKWQNELEDNLKSTRYCIVCVTFDNFNSPWINYEAGAIAHSLNAGRVCAILFDMSKTDLKGPLASFQNVAFTQEEMGAVIDSINGAAEDDKIPDDRVSRSFEKWWPDLEEAISKIRPKQVMNPKHSRSQGDILEEVLLNTRNLILQISERDENSTKRELPRLNFSYAKLVTSIVKSNSEFTQNTHRACLIHGRNLIFLNNIVGKNDRQRSVRAVEDALDQLSDTYKESRRINPILFAENQDDEEPSISDDGRTLGDILGEALKKGR